MRTRFVRLGVLACALLAAAGAVGAATVGGGFWTAFGPGKIAVKRSGIKPLPIFGNLKFDFDGASSDLEGSATIRAYDEAGGVVLGTFSAAWTTGKGAAFRFDVAGEEFRAFVEERIEAGSGQAATVVLETAAGKGRLAVGGTDLRATLAATGTCALGEGEPRKFRLVLHLR